MEDEIMDGIEDVINDTEETDDESMETTETSEGVDFTKIAAVAGIAACGVTLGVALGALAKKFVAPKAINIGQKIATDFLEKHPVYDGLAENR